MAQFFFKIDMVYQQKNKLYEEFMHFVKKWDSTWISSRHNLLVFETLLKDKVRELNEKHKRCKPISVDIGQWAMNDYDNEVDVRVPGSWTGSIYAIKKELR